MRLNSIYKGDRGSIIIETITDRSFLGIKLKPTFRMFIANKEFPTGYWDWYELPKLDLVYDGLSFQLDKWMRQHQINNK